MATENQHEHTTQNGNKYLIAPTCIVPKLWSMKVMPMYAVRKDNSDAEIIRTTEDLTKALLEDKMIGSLLYEKPTEDKALEDELRIINIQKGDELHRYSELPSGLDDFVYAKNKMEVFALKDDSTQLETIQSQEQFVKAKIDKSTRLCIKIGKETKGGEFKPNPELALEIFNNLGHIV